MSHDDSTVAMADFSTWLISLSILLFFLLPDPIMAQAYQNISVGSSLTAGNGSDPSWTSPSGEFAIGFQKPETGLSLLAIWFNNIRERTIVWSANGPNPVQPGSSIALRDDRFVLTDHGGEEVWRASLNGSSSTSAIAYAAMLDTGNFVLVSTQGRYLWDSFSHPTDTILPTQQLNLGMGLVARYSNTNYSMGRFGLTMQGDGNLVLFTLSYPLDTRIKEYWETGTVDTGSHVSFNNGGNLYLVTRNGSRLSVTREFDGAATEFYQRAVLEYDGAFSHYVFPKTSMVSAARRLPMSWSLIDSVPSNICLISQDTGGGACGFNSYCVMGSDQRPRCECPYGYSFRDPNDTMSGCKPDFALHNCEELQDAGNFFFRDMTNTDWPGTAYEEYKPVTEDWCRQACLVDCFCHVAIVYNNTCWKKRLPMSNGMQDPEVGGKSLIKQRNGSVSYNPRKGCKKDRSSLIVIGSVFLGSYVFMSLVVLVATILVVSWSGERKVRNQHVILTPVMQGVSLQSFTYRELEMASSGFREEIGRGAFSTVYKGALSIGDRNLLIAIKRLDKMVTENEREFEAEVSAIGRTHHKNLVQLLGYCNEGEHRLLVYEYMSNGSLAGYLFSSPRPAWFRRIEIACGVARGLVYLHEECDNQIIHCDIKPQNILLDDSFTARISDFGLAKLLNTEQTRTVTAKRGTKGYVAPEWFKNMAVTAKVDIYSFGILLLELICCRKSFIQNLEDEGQMVLADWAYDCYQYNETHLLVKDDEEAVQELKSVHRFVMIAIWCILEEPTMRPSMKKVLQMLEGDVDVPLPPPQPQLSATTSS